MYSHLKIYLLQIVERRLILNCGFVDTSAQVKKYIEDTLLPEWIDHYDNILSFMKSIRLDADENDIEKTTILVEMILPIYFKYIFFISKQLVTEKYIIYFLLE